MKKALFLAFLGIFIAAGINTVQAYEIIGDYVIEDNENVYIETYPHTFNFSGQSVSHCFTPKRYTGDAVFVFGFDNDIIDIDGVKIKEKGKMKTKTKKKEKFIYGDMDTWHWISTNVTAGEDVCMKTEMAAAERAKGKYWVCFGEGKTPEEAISNGRYYCSDPWYDLDYLYRAEINASNSGGESFVYIPINGTSGFDFGTGQQYFWCNYTINETVRTVGYLYYNNGSDYRCINLADTERVSMFMDEGNETDYEDPEETLMAWYHLNGSAEAYDFSLYNDNHGTASGAPALNRSGRIGSAIEMDGNDYYDIGDQDDMEGISAFSVSAWIRMNPITAISNIVSKMDGSATSEYSWWSYVNSDGTLNAFLRTGANCQATSPNAIDNNTWYHYAWTYDGDVLNLYIDGVLNDTADCTDGNIQATDTNVSIGAEMRATPTGLLDGAIDEVRIYNRTLSAADIELLYNFGNQDLGAEEEAPEEVPIVTITSPANTTYLQTSIPLTWGYVAANDTNSSCASAVYSLDGADNVSMGCTNTTITVDDIGQSERNVIVTATAADGNFTSTTAHFTVIYGNYTVNIFEEMAGSAYNTSDMELKVFCDNETQTETPTNHTFDLEVECDYNRIVLTITNTTGSTITRSLIPTDRNGTLEFYMINITGNNTEIDIAQTWQIFDLSGIYEGGIIRITKVIEDLGTRTMTEQFIDAEAKVFVDLILGETYSISIFDDSFGNERSIGGIETTSETTINIEVSTVAYQTDSRIPARDVFVTFSQDEDDQTIQVSYNDTLDQTTTVNVQIVNASNTSQVFLDSDSTASVVTFTLNNVDTNSSYIATVTATHERYGSLEESKVISFTEEAAMYPANISGLGYGVFLGGAATLVSLFVLLGFSKRHAKMGLVTATLVFASFMFWGWFADVPQMNWGIITLVIIIAVVGVMSLRRRFN